MAATQDPAQPTTAGAVATSEQRLHRGVLSLVDIAASTMANIGPAYSFFFGFAFLTFTAGIASPLTFVVAGIAVALLGNTVSQFTRVLPSTGGFVTYIGKTFGARSAVASALVVTAGYIIAISSVLAVCGGFLSITVEKYFHTTVPWGIFSVILTIGAVYTMIRGVGVSTKLAAFFFGFELLVLVVVSIVAIARNGTHLSVKPFDPSKIHNGLSGLAAAFPLAVYAFLGWENSASLAEETANPRRDVPRAIYFSVAAMALGYVLFGYATITGLNYNVGSVTGQQLPFLTVAAKVLPGLAFCAYIAGMTSTIGVLISAANSQARLLFNAGREGLLPAWVGKVHPKRRTPMNALLVFVAIGGTIIIGWVLGHVIGGSTDHLDAVTYFAESSTMGTILVLVVYLAANLALPVYFHRNHRDRFNPLKHLILPVLGAASIVVPLYYLAKPGQPSPYDWFPWAAAILIAVAAVYAFVVVARKPTIGDRIGSLLADD